MWSVKLSQVGRPGPLTHHFPSYDLNLYLSREPRGFAFIEFVDPYDASEAQYHMNGQLLGGRRITVVVAAETRKRPEEMRVRTRARYIFFFVSQFFSLGFVECVIFDPWCRTIAFSRAFLSRRGSSEYDGRRSSYHGMLFLNSVFFFS